MDSEDILICEVHKIAKNISQLFSADLHTPKADKVLDSLSWDENNNMQVVLNAKSESHTVTTDFKRTRKHFSIDEVKEDLRRIRSEVILCISDNITDQNSEVDLASMMVCFDFQLKSG